MAVLCLGAWKGQIWHFAALRPYKLCCGGRAVVTPTTTDVRRHDETLMLTRTLCAAINRVARTCLAAGYTLVVTVTLCRRGSAERTTLAHKYVH
jgi:hypothetical protein